MDIAFKKSADGSGWDVLVDDAVIGRLVRREQIGRNLVKDFRYSGPGRRVALWEGTVAGVGLDEHDLRAVQRGIVRPKTNRESAARHIIDAYRAAGVPLPSGEGRQAA